MYLINFNFKFLTPLYAVTEGHQSLLTLEPWGEKNNTVEFSAWADFAQSDTTQSIFGTTLHSSPKTEFFNRRGDRVNNADLSAQTPLEYLINFTRETLQIPNHEIDAQFSGSI